MINEAVVFFCMFQGINMSGRSRKGILYGSV